MTQPPTTPTNQPPPAKPRGRRSVHTSTRELIWFGVKIECVVVVASLIVIGILRLFGVFDALLKYSGANIVFVTSGAVAVFVALYVMFTVGIRRWIAYVKIVDKNAE